MTVLPDDPRAIWLRALRSCAVTSTNSTPTSCIRRPRRRDQTTRTGIENGSPKARTTRSTALPSGKPRSERVRSRRPPADASITGPHELSTASQRTRPCRRRSLTGSGPALARTRAHMQGLSNRREAGLTPLSGSAEPARNKVAPTRICHQPGVSRSDTVLIDGRGGRSRSGAVPSCG